ncbi:MAG: SGNH/GDSL hydrolase family protein [Paracoccaceae bacterium]
MRPLRWIAGAVAVGLGALVVLWGSDRPWTPIDRAMPPVRQGTDTLRIVTFGTSLTARGTWPDDLGAALSGCLGRPVEVTRVAEPGASSAWGEGRLAEVIAARPDVLLIEFAINDADLRDGLWLNDSIARHDAILTQITSALPGTSVALMTMNPAFGARGWARPRLAAYYRAYDQLAARHKTGVIDLYALWRARPDPRQGIADGLHPDATTASALIAPAVAASVGAPTGVTCG